jgi:cobalt-zinc-cadmium efflux system membrane fusion protein
MRQIAADHRTLTKAPCVTNLPSNCRCLAGSGWPSARVLLALAGAAAYGFVHIGKATARHSDVSSQSRKGLQRYTPTPAEWASLTIEPVTEKAFRAEHVTEGKIAVDEDRSTPVFSPYAGRVTKLLARPATRSSRDSRCS